MLVVVVVVLVVCLDGAEVGGERGLSLGRLRDLAGGRVGLRESLFALKPTLQF